MSKNRRFLSLILALGMILGMMSGATVAQGEEESLPIYLDTSYSFEERAADLVHNMTLAEKAGQMISGFAPAIPRLGVSWYNWWNEALHGISREGAQSSGATTIYNLTSYPINMSMGSTWDPDLMYRIGTQIGDEGREVVNSTPTEYASGRFNGLTYWSPTVNLNRDPRWGRSDESYSEDPFLTASIASQFTNGMEGKDKEGNLLDQDGYLKVVTTMKHYFANNSENNRLNGSSNLTEREIREYYSYAYRLMIRNSDISSVMAAYNRVNETPANLDARLLDTLLRQTFGFNGYVTSDCDSVAVAYMKGFNTTIGGQATTIGGFDVDRNWTTTPNRGHGWRLPNEDGSQPGRWITGPETVAWAVSAGGDLQCNGGYSSVDARYSTVIPRAVDEKIVTPTGLFDENSVDVSLLRLFTARMKLGEFDWATPGAVKWYDDAKSRIAGYGEDWSYASSATNGAITMTDERIALSEEAADKALVLLKNDPVGDTGKKLLPLQIPKTGSFKVAVIGHFANPTPTASNYMFLGGYSCNMGSSAHSKMINPYGGISAAVKAVNPDAEVTFYKGFTDTGTTAATLLNIDPDAIEAAKAADLCVVFVGTDSGSANESNDRIAGIAIPGAQPQLIKAVGEANPNTVAVMETISQNDVSAFEANVPAMLWSCYNGQVKGAALANVLTGKYNPSGRTSTIWYKNVDQIANVRSYKLTPGVDDYPDLYNGLDADGNPMYGYSFGETNGRTYMYYDESKGGALQYPFGYGLSYTTFAYSNLKVNGLNESDVVDANGVLAVSVDVTNTGDYDGAEVVELYVATPGAPAEKEYPFKRLRSFDKVELKKGETKTVTFSVDVSDLAFFNEAAGKFEVYNGVYQLQISKSSWDKDIQLSKDFTVTGAILPKISVVSAKPNQDGDAELDIPHRVFFNFGKTVYPQLTIAMSDDTLYGYVMKGESVAIPDNFTITYESNRPSVASVDASGKITVVGKGVATITATVTDSISGATGTCDFIVYNAEDRGDAIRVTSAINTIVEGYAANIPFNLVAPEDASLTVKLLAPDGKEVGSNIGTSGLFRIVSKAVNGTYILKAYENGQEIGTGCEIECVESPPTLWSPSVTQGEGGVFYIKFGATVDIQKAGITLNNKVVTDFDMSLTDDSVIDVKAPLEYPVVISRIKYPELFPSYSFTFTITS